MIVTIQLSKCLNLMINFFTGLSINIFQVMFDSYNISYDDFIRTTETRHHETAQKFWVSNL